MKITQITAGQKYGCLTAIEKSYSDGGGLTWTFDCECGNRIDARARHVIAGHTVSCGCYKRQRSSDAHTVHGDNRRSKRTVLYRRWLGMMSRCSIPSNKDYYRYGGRGITVCEEWHVFENFKQWSLNNGYRDDLEIDRRNNDGDYTPDNCRWVTHVVNCSTTSKAKHITVNGITRCYNEWCRIIGMKSNAVSYWVKKHGEAEAANRIANRLYGKTVAL